MAATLTSDISAKLKAPFPNVSWRVQSSKGSETKARVVAYVDARDIMDRLDEVVGPDNWSFDWEPITTANGQVLTAKGTLTVCGISRSDIGEAGDIEKSKAAVSDALKRAAVHFGCARYLYDLGAQWAAVDQYKNILPAEIAKLNKTLEARLSGKVQQVAAQPEPPRQNNAPAPAQSKQTPVKLSDEVFRIQATAKELAKKLGIAWSFVCDTAKTEKYKTDITTPEGSQKVLEWLRTPGMAVAMWRWSIRINEAQYKNYKEQNHRTDEQVYADLQVSAEQRGDMLAAMKGVAA